MGVLENRKEYFFAFMGLLFYKSKKKRRNGHLVG